MMGNWDSIDKMVENEKKKAQERRIADLERQIKQVREPEKTAKTCVFQGEEGEGTQCGLTGQYYYNLKKCVTDICPIYQTMILLSEFVNKAEEE